MDDLLRLAYESLMKFGEISPALMEKLVEFYLWRAELMLKWGWILIGVSAVMFAVSVLLFFIAEDWGHEISVGVGVLLIILGCCLLILGITTAVDSYIARKALELAPEVYVIRKLVGK